MSQVSYSFFYEYYYHLLCNLRNSQYTIYFHQKFCGIFHSWFHRTRKELLSTYCAMRIHSEQDKNQKLYLKKKNDGSLIVEEKNPYYEVGQYFLFCYGTTSYWKKAFNWVIKLRYLVRIRNSNRCLFRVVNSYCK